MELTAGTYETACKPGMAGKGIRGGFKVTGSAAPLTADAALLAATESYQRYVKSQTDTLLVKTQEFVDAVEAGDIAKANAEKLSPLQLANGAKELLDEVATGKITGEEDRYSHTDLWDFAANVQGSRAAVKALRPVLEQRSPALVSELDAAFAAVETALGKHRAGDGWRLHNELSQAELKELSDVINALAEPEMPLQDLPHFAGDMLRAEISGGDICVQACSHDPQVAVHAVRNLARIGFGVVSVRYSQLGFISRSRATPRNLMGFKDGTANPKLEEHLWVPVQDGPDWMVGGTYLVTRRVRMLIETWDRTPLAEQDTIIGRDKGEGAPLGRTHEFDEPDFSLMAPEPHIRLAHPTRRQWAAGLLGRHAIHLAWVGEDSVAAGCSGARAPAADAPRHAGFPVGDRP